MQAVANIREDLFCGIIADMPYLSSKSLSSRHLQSKKLIISEFAQQIIWAPFNHNFIL